MLVGIFKKLKFLYLNLHKNFSWQFKCFVSALFKVSRLSNFQNILTPFKNIILAIYFYGKSQLAELGALHKNMSFFYRLISVSNKLEVKARQVFLTDACLVLQVPVVLWVQVVLSVEAVLRAPVVREANCPVVRGVPNSFISLIKLGHFTK